MTRTPTITPTPRVRDPYLYQGCWKIGLAGMDGTATLCRDNKLIILVFDLADPDNIAALCRVRTWVHWSTRAEHTASFRQ